MPRYRLYILGSLLSAVLAVPAIAEGESAIHWHKDLDTATAEAGQTGRLILVHFWTPSCGPCRVLERNVFSQPNVASYLQSQFVPVKLNAHEQPALAQQLGVTRVPTDVILSPQGDIVGKFISPTTPTAYVSEVTELANQYASRSGAAFDRAVAAAAQPPVNSAYAGLSIGQTSPPAAERQSIPVETRYETPAQVANNPYVNYSPGGTTSIPSSAGVTQAQPQQTAPTAASGRYQVAAQPSQQPVYSQPQQQPIAVPQPPQRQRVTQAPQNTTPIQAATPPVAAQRYAIAPQQPATPQQQSIAPPTSQIKVNAPIAPAATQQAANTPAGTTVLSDGRQLPPGAPPLGFDGYCPVTMRGEWKWVKGDPAWGAIHRGRTYWFAGPEQQKAFLGNPDLFGPALSGIDPVVAFDHQEAVSGKREHSLDYDNQFYLFSSEQSLNAFVNNPERYASGVRQAMSPSGGRIIR